jgi:hypothetical protein
VDEREFEGGEVVIVTDLIVGGGLMLKDLFSKKKPVNGIFIRFEPKRFEYIRFEPNKINQVNYKINADAENANCTKSNEES